MSGSDTPEPSGMSSVQSCFSRCRCGTTGRMTSAPLYTELFANDPMLPAQMPLRQKVVNTGEKRLMLAVLEDAVKCALMEPVPRTWRCGPPDARGRPWDEALRWMLDTDWDWPFSFVNICETLKISPDAVRESIRGKLAARRSPLAVPPR